MGTEGPITVRENYSKRRVVERADDSARKTEPTMLAPEVEETFKKVLAKWQGNSSEQELLFTLASSEGFRNLEPKLQSIALYYFGGHNATFSTDAREALRKAMKQEDYSHHEVGVQDRLLREFLIEQRSVDWTVELPKDFPLERQDYKILRIRKMEYEFTHGVKPALAYEVQFGTQKINVIVPEKTPSIEGNLNDPNVIKPHTLGEILEALANTPGEFRSVITKVVNEGTFSKSDPNEKRAYMSANSSGEVRVHSARRHHGHARYMVGGLMHESGHILTLRAWGTEANSSSENWGKYERLKKQSFDLAVSEYPRDKERGSLHEDAAELGVHNYIERKLGRGDEVRETFPGRAEMVARLQAPVWNQAHKPREQLIRQFALESLSGKQMQSTITFLEKGDNALKFGPAISQFITDRRFIALDKSSQSTVLEFIKKSPNLTSQQEGKILRLIQVKGFSSISNEAQVLFLKKFTEGESGSWAYQIQLLDSPNFLKLNSKAQKLVIEAMNNDFSASVSIVDLGKSKGFGYLSHKLQNQVLKEIISAKGANRTVGYGFGSDDFSKVPAKLHGELISCFIKGKDLGFESLTLVKLYTDQNFISLSEKTRNNCVSAITKHSSLSYELREVFASENFKLATPESQNLIIERLTAQKLSSSQLFAFNSVMRDSAISKFGIEFQKLFFDLLLSNPDNYDLRSLVAKSGLANFSKGQQLKFISEYGRQLGNKNVEKNLLAMSSGGLFPTLSVKMQDRLFANLGREHEYSISSFYSDPVFLKLKLPIKEALAESTLVLSGSKLSSLFYAVCEKNFTALSPSAQASYIKEYRENPSYQFQYTVDKEGFDLLSPRVQTEIFRILGSQSKGDEKRLRHLSQGVSKLFEDESFTKLKESRQLELLKALSLSQTPRD